MLKRYTIGTLFCMLIRWYEYYCEADFQNGMEVFSERERTQCLQPVSPYHCFGLQVGRLLQQLAMTGSEEGDPRTKSSLGKFDKVRMNTTFWEIVFIENLARVLVNLPILFLKSCSQVMDKGLNILSMTLWCNYSAYNIGSAAFKGRCH